MEPTKIYAAYAEVNMCDECDKMRIETGITNVLCFDCAKKDKRQPDLEPLPEIV